MLAIEYHVHIWQVSPQLSRADTCQKWMRFKKCSRYFCQIENFAYGEIDKRNFSNPHPWPSVVQILSALHAKPLFDPRPTFCQILEQLETKHNDIVDNEPWLKMRPNGTQSLIGYQIWILNNQNLIVFFLICVLPCEPMLEYC